MKISYFISMVSVWAMIVAAFAVAPLDEGVWPVVVPEFKAPSARTVKGAYFRGRVIRSSEEVKKGCAYRFRRTCSFKMKPAEGWVQFIGIGAAELKLNDKSIAQNSYWPKPTVKEVSKYLKAGVMVDGKYEDTVEGTIQGGLCLYPHNPPYVEFCVMSS